MSRNRIFISSTCFDLIDVRAELKRALEHLGYVAYTSETPDFPVSSRLSLVDNCLSVLKHSDIYLLIIHTRYGGLFTGSSLIDIPPDLPTPSLSVTFAEYLTARAAGLE